MDDELKAKLKGAGVALTPWYDGDPKDWTISVEVRTCQPLDAKDLSALKDHLVRSGVKIDDANPASYYERLSILSDRHISPEQRDRDMTTIREAFKGIAPTVVRNLNDPLPEASCPIPVSALDRPTHGRG